MRKSCQNSGVGKMEHQDPEVESPNHAFRRRVHEVAGAVRHASVVTRMSSASSWPAVNKLGDCHPVFVKKESLSIEVTEEVDYVSAIVGEDKFVVKAQEMTDSLIFSIEALNRMDDAGIASLLDARPRIVDNEFCMYHKAQETDVVLKSLRENTAHCQMQRMAYANAVLLNKMAQGKALSEQDLKNMSASNKLFARSPPSSVPLNMVNNGHAHPQFVMLVVPSRSDQYLLNPMPSRKNDYVDNLSEGHQRNGNSFKDQNRKPRQFISANNMAQSNHQRQRTLSSDQNMKFISEINKTNTHLPPAHLALNMVNRAVHSQSQWSFFNPPPRNDQFLGSSVPVRKNEYFVDQSEGYNRSGYNSGYKGPARRYRTFGSSNNVTQTSQQQSSQGYYNSKQNRGPNLRFPSSRP